MEGIGWEIRPAGWILLFVVAVILIYYVVKWLRRFSHKNQGKT